MDGPVWRAFQDWGLSYKKISNLVGLTWEGLASLTITPNVLEQLIGPSASVEQGRQTGALAQVEIDNGFGTLHGVALLGLWGVFESYIGDMFMGTLVTDKDLLTGPGFEKVTVPLALTLASEAEVHRYLLDFSRTIKKKDASEKSGAIGAQESLLRLINLNGEVPDKVGANINQAYHIRNLWAHNAGRADQKFLDRVPGLDVAVGEEVHLDRHRFELLVNALNIYAVIVFNRFSLKYGLRPIAMDLPGYEGVLAGMFPTALGLAPGKSPSDLDAPPA